MDTKENEENYERIQISIVNNTDIVKKNSVTKTNRKRLLTKN